MRKPKGKPTARESKRFAFVQSLERGLAVIKSFDEGHSMQTLADVARATGLDRSAARRFLLTLEALGYVEQKDRLFYLRPQTLQLGYSYLASLPWWRNAHEVAEKLTVELFLSTAVGVLDHQNVVYVAYASPGRFPFLHRSVGTQLPAFATAVGRVLLAGLPRDDLQSWLAEAKLNSYTPRTLTSPAALETALDEIRTAGFAVVDQELEAGLRSIGVPILDRAGRTVAGMSVSLIEGQTAWDTMIEHCLGPLQNAAKQITQMLPT